VITDREDSVPADQKSQARLTVLAALYRGNRHEIGYALRTRRRRHRSPLVTIRRERRCCERASV
jgi:citrate lyase beta subunit